MFSFLEDMRRDAVKDMLKDRILDFFIKKYGKNGELNFSKEELGLIEHEGEDCYSQVTAHPFVYVKTPPGFVCISSDKSIAIKKNKEEIAKAKTKAKTKAKPKTKTKAPAKRGRGRPKKVK